MRRLLASHSRREHGPAAVVLSCSRSVIVSGTDIVAASSDDVQSGLKKALRRMILPTVALDPRSWVLLSGYVEQQEYDFSATSVNCSSAPDTRVLRTAGAVVRHHEGGAAVQSYTQRRRQARRASINRLDAFLDGEESSSPSGESISGPSSSVSSCHQYGPGDLRVSVSPTFHTYVPAAPTLEKNSFKRRDKFKVSATMSHNGPNKNKFAVNKRLHKDPFRAGSFDLDYLSRLAFAEEQRKVGARNVFGVDSEVTNRVPSGGVAELFVYSPEGVWEPIPAADTSSFGMQSGLVLEFTSDEQRRALMTTLLERVLVRADASTSPGVADWLQSRISTYLTQQPSAPPPPGWSQAILVPSGISPVDGSVSRRLFADVVPKDSLITLLRDVVKR